MSIITTANLRSYLDQLEAGASVDTQLAEIITRAQGMIDVALGFSFFDAGTEWAAIPATQKRVQSERSVYLKLLPYHYGSITALAPITGITVSTDVITDYEETEKQFYLYRPQGWGGGRWAVTAKYGYGPAPAAIVEVCLELAVNIWRQKGQGLFQQIQGVDSVGNAVGGGSLKYIGGMTTEQQRIVKRVRAQFIEVMH